MGPTITFVTALSTGTYSQYTTFILIALQSTAKQELYYNVIHSTVSAVARPKNDDQITFRVPASDKRDLKIAAEHRDRTHNWLARDIVLKWLAKERKRRRR
jgi:hypothetical protein